MVMYTLLTEDCLHWNLYTCFGCTVQVWIQIFLVIALRLLPLSFGKKKTYIVFYMPSDALVVTGYLTNKDYI